MRIRRVRVRLQKASYGRFGFAQHSLLQEQSRWSERGIWSGRFARLDCIFGNGWTNVRLGRASQLRRRQTLLRSARRTLRPFRWTMQEANETYDAGEAK